MNYVCFRQRVPHVICSLLQIPPPAAEHCAPLDLMVLLVGFESFQCFDEVLSDFSYVCKDICSMLNFVEQDLLKYQMLCACFAMLDRTRHQQVL